MRAPHSVWVELDRLLADLGIQPSWRRKRRGRHRAGWIELGTEEPSGRIRRVQEYVTGHIGEVRALDELADVAGLSRFHFARRFREEVGEPPWAYVRRVRAEEAVRRLEAGRAPAEVAFETGFADQAHLTREVRTHFGTTPGRIARRQENEHRKPVQDEGRPAV